MASISKAKPTVRALVVIPNRYKLSFVLWQFFFAADDADDKKIS